MSAKRICVFGSASKNIDESYIPRTEEVCKQIASKGFDLVFGGAAQSLMGAAARGFRASGANIIGVVPKYLDSIQPRFECDEFHVTKTLNQRKQLMKDKADAYLIVPGGLGTLDEFFEVLVEDSFFKKPKPIVLFNMDGYYDSLMALIDDYAKRGVLHEDVGRFLLLTDNAEVAAAHLASEIK